MPPKNPNRKQQLEKNRKKQQEFKTDSPPMLDAELAKIAAECTHDPLKFTLMAYKWGEGSLEKYKGPQAWQANVLQYIGDQLKSDPFKPIRIARSSGHGTGKDLYTQSTIYTNDGIKTVGELKAGDMVFGLDGRPTMVTGIPYRGRKRCYRVTFDDGSSVLCGPSHEWTVRGRGSRRTGEMTWETLETQEILRRGVKRSNGKTANNAYGGAKQWEIPQQGAVQFDARHTDLHPYVLGAWLGNGSADAPSITVADDCPETADRITALGYPYSVFRDGDKKCSRLRLRGVAETMRRLCCFGKRSWEKFVPDDYKFNTADVRAEVLRGLLDTDGECDAKGSVFFSSTSKQLAEDVVWLARSLGGKARLQATPKQGQYIQPNGEKKLCRLCYRATVRLPGGIEPFTVKKKLSRVKPAQSRYLTRWIQSIEPDDELRDTMCISVEAADGLYQTGDFIVTHNSALVSWVTYWAMATCPNCRVMVTANTYQQLMTKTWPELSIWHERSIFSHWFRLNNSSMVYSLFSGKDKTWRADAITWGASNTEAFAGLHNRGSRIVIIIDEASAVIDKIWEVIEGALTDEDTEILWLVFGNPTRNTGRFRECFRRYRNLWNTARIDSRQVDVTNKNLFKIWAQAYGEDSDFFRVRVTGEFPDAASGQLIPTSLVHEAQKRKYRYDDYKNSDHPKIIGVDIARMGDDASSIWLRQGMFCKRLAKTHKTDLQQFSSMLLAFMEKEKPDHVFIDAGNFGIGVYDNLKAWNQHRIVTPVYFQNSPADTRQYANLRIEMWDKMRLWLEHGGMLPPHTTKENAGLDIENDLIAPEFFYNQAGKKMLESKKAMKERGIPSPDDGDALALTFAREVKKAGVIERVRRMLGQTKGQYADDSWSW